LLVLLFHDDLQFDQEELEIMVATRNLWLRTMPLQEAQQIVDFGERGVPGNMFPLEFLSTVDNKSTEVSGGGEPQPQEEPSPNPLAQFQQGMQTLLDLKSFQDVLDNVWLATELADATLMRLQAFVQDGVRICE
jgi:hypothetical protein